MLPKTLFSNDKMAVPSQFWEHAHTHLGQLTTESSSISNIMRFRGEIEPLLSVTFHHVSQKLHFKMMLQPY